MLTDRAKEIINQTDGKMPIIVFDMNATGNLTKLLAGEKVGTLVHP